MPRIELIKTTLVHKGFNTFVKIKVHKDIEDYFKNASLEADPETGTPEPVIEVSNSWKDENGQGLPFYKKVKNLSSLVSNSGQRVSVADSFGDSVLGGTLNVAFLRIVGIGEGEGKMIETTELINGENLRLFLKNLRSWLKAFYETELMNQEIEGAVFVDVGN